MLADLTKSPEYCTSRRSKAFLVSAGKDPLPQITPLEVKNWSDTGSAFTEGRLIEIFLRKLFSSTQKNPLKK